jgi:20S proteasome subunit alpha 5
LTKRVAEAQLEPVIYLAPCVSANQNHWFTYNENIKVESITQAVCDLALQFGESGGGKTMVYGEGVSNPYPLLLPGSGSDAPWLLVVDRAGLLLSSLGV